MKIIIRIKNNSRNRHASIFGPSTSRSPSFRSQITGIPEDVLAMADAAIGSSPFDGSDSLQFGPSSMMGFAEFSNNNSPEQNIRSALSGLSHLIWIESIKPADPFTSDFICDENTFVVTCKPQGSVIENLDLKKQVECELKFKGNLQLVDIQIQQTRFIPGIKKRDDNLYEADLYFSEYLATHDQYRKNMINNPIVEVSFEVAENNRGTFYPTGKIGTTTAPSPREFDPANIYNCYALALNESEELRNDIINSNISEILLILNEAYKFGISITKKSRYNFNYESLKPKKTESTVISGMDKLTMTDRSNNEINKAKNQAFIEAVTKFVPGEISSKTIEKALRIAASKNDLQSLEIISGKCENLNAQDDNPMKLYTALHWAVKCNAIDAVRYLLSQPSININIKDAKGQTPRDLAMDGTNEMKELFNIKFENSLQKRKGF